MKADGRISQSIQSEGSGVGPIAVCPKAKLIAYAECTIQPKIFVLNYPGCQVVTVLEGMQIIHLYILLYALLNPGGAQLEYSHLAFSSDGKKLASLSSVPDFTLSLW